MISTMDFEDFKFHDVKDASPYIRKIESLWRQSPQYKAYIAAVFDSKPFLSALGLENENIADEDGMTIELHHCIGLYELTVISIEKLSESGMPYFTMWDVLKELEHMHLKDMLPTCLLTKTAHEAYHAGLWKYDKDEPGLNLGDYDSLISEYGKYLGRDSIDELMRLGADSRILNEWEDSNEKR